MKCGELQRATRKLNDLKRKIEDQGIDVVTCEPFLAAGNNEKGDGEVANDDDTYNRSVMLIKECFTKQCIDADGSLSSVNALM